MSGGGIGVAFLGGTNVDNGGLATTAGAVDFLTTYGFTEGAANLSNIATCLSTSSRVKCR